MHLSIIFGTYNRLAMLQASIAAARKSIEPCNITHEFVICDGGSTDGSREWLLAQDDVVLIAKRSLDGAVDAFNLCARAARGAYLVHLNDDCEVLGTALADGFAAMERDPAAGLGVFQLNTKNVTIDKDAEGWGYEHANGRCVLSNFGIVRRALVDQLHFIVDGFWAPVYWTYAGDSELSLWAVKLGWKVLKLSGRVRDLRNVSLDGLREGNKQRANADTALYCQRWHSDDIVDPDGPWPELTDVERARYSAWLNLDQRQRAVTPVRAVDRPRSAAAASVLAPITPRTRISATSFDAVDPTGDTFPMQLPAPGYERTVHLHLATPEEQQPAHVAALKNISRAGYFQYSWCGHKPDEVQRTLLQMVEQYKPTLVWMQLQNPDALTPAVLAEARKHLPPGGVLATWDGDCSTPNSVKDTDIAWQAALAAQCDLALFFSWDHVQKIRAAGVPQAAYLQAGYDHNWFYPAAPTLRTRHAVVYLGNNYNLGTPRNLRGTGDETTRHRMVDAVYAAFGKPSFGLYGGGWGEKSSGTTNARESGHVYRTSLCAINCSLVNTLRYMSSDRLPRALACGCCVLVERFPGTEIWGLKDGVNCVLWSTFDELVEKARYMIEHRSEALAVGVAGAKLAVEHHTWDVRMRELQPLLDVARNRQHP